MSFSPDVFGGNARRVEQQAALAENQAFQLAAAQLTISGNVVTQALTIASIRLQTRAIEEIVAEDEQTLVLVQRKVDVGRSPRTELLIAESQLANDRALLPPLGQQLAAAEDALTVLLGKYPAAWSAPAFDLTDFTLPADLPVSLPLRAGPAAPGYPRGRGAASRQQRRCRRRGSPAVPNHHSIRFGR